MLPEPEEGFEDPYKIRISYEDEYEIKKDRIAQIKRNRAQTEANAVRIRTEEIKHICRSFSYDRASKELRAYGLIKDDLTQEEYDRFCGHEKQIGLSFWPDEMDMYNWLLRQEDSISCTIKHLIKAAMKNTSAEEI